MFNTLTRRALLAAAASSALLVSAPAIAAAKQGAAVTNTYNDWFRIGAAAQENWRIVGDPDDPNIAHVIGHDRKVGDAAQKVMVVYPRPSSAYDVAITQILSVFAAKGLDTEVLAYNFKKDDVRGQGEVFIHCKTFPRNAHPPCTPSLGLVICCLPHQAMKLATMQRLSFHPAGGW